MIHSGAKRSQRLAGGQEVSSLHLLFFFSFFSFSVLSWNTLVVVAISLTMIQTIISPMHFNITSPHFALHDCSWVTERLASKGAWSHPKLFFFSPQSFFLRVSTNVFFFFYGGGGFQTSRTTGFPRFPALPPEEGTPLITVESSKLHVWVLWSFWFLLYTSSDSLTSN